jgi:protein-tyrosine-phosphatase
MGKRSEKTVLFLCTGNYYRSRVAEALFNSVADRMGLPWRASSRGLALERGVNNVGPMAASAVKALEAMGVRAGDAITRMPAQVTTDDLEGAALIVALKHAEHLPLLQERFPTWVHSRSCAGAGWIIWIPGEIHSLARGWHHECRTARSASSAVASAGRGGLRDSVRC